MKSKSYRKIYIACSQFTVRMLSASGAYDLKLMKLPEHLVLCVGTDKKSKIKNQGQGLTISKISGLFLLNDRGETKDLSEIDGHKFDSLEELRIGLFAGDYRSTKHLVVTARQD